jgi:hypothetical protein
MPIRYTCTEPPDMQKHTHTTPNPQTIRIASMYTEPSRKHAKYNDPEHFNGRCSSPAHVQRLRAKSAPSAELCLILRLSLLLRCPNMRIMNLCRKLQACNRFLQMCLQWADHDEHEGLGVAAEGVLEEVGQLYHR